MKKLPLIMLLIVISFTLNFGQTAPAGDGSASNPYQIATKDNLLWVQNNSSEWGKYYIQTADIDLAESSIKIGNSTTKFTGSYDGGGYKIDNLTSDAGLFVEIDGATIEKLGLTNVNLNGSGFIGALIVHGINSTVKNCYSTGSVTSSSVNVGGLVGKYEGTNSKISDCYSKCSVTGTSTGLVYAGGLVGYLINQGSSIEKSYATGNVTASSSTNSGTCVGGLVGYNNTGTISECYSRGDVEGSGRVGGFVGTSYFAGSSISNCYSFGDVTRPSGITDETFGGFVGKFGLGIIKNCYSIGSVTYGGATSPTDKGFAGVSLSSITACFFDKEASNQATDDKATGKTTAEMQTQTTFTDAGWDFTNTWEIIAPASSSSNGLAKVNTDGNYPRLQNQPDEALPVELTTFSASVSDDAVVLSWTTATEVNNYGFEVERKQTGYEWNKIGFVEGSGNSNSTKNYTYTDNTLNGGKYLYRLKQIDIDGKFEYSNEIEVDLSTPLRYSLEQNYPNPFNPATNIRFSLPEASKVKLVVYNLIGEKVAELVNGKMESGNHSVVFNASGLTSGVYIYKIVADSYGETHNYIKTMKMLLIK